MGRREQENRKRKASAKSCQSLDTWVSKVPREELSDTDNDSAVCDNSPAETTTSDLSQLTTVFGARLASRLLELSRARVYSPAPQSPSPKLETNSVENPE